MELSEFKHKPGNKMWHTETDNYGGRGSESWMTAPDIVGRSNKVWSVSNREGEEEGSRVSYVHRLRSVARELDTRHRVLDMVRVATLLIGVIASGLLLTGFVWTFISVEESIKLSVSGAGGVILGGLSGFCVSYRRRRLNLEAITEITDELKSFKIQPDQFGNVIQSFCDILTERRARYSIQFPLLIILPLISLMNGIHNYQYYVYSSNVTPNTFDSVTLYAKVLLSVDGVMACLMLCANMAGLFFYCYKTYRFKETRVAGNIRDIASTFYF